MAIIKTTNPKIKTAEHLSELIDYVDKPKTRDQKEKLYKTSYNLCSKTKKAELLKDWENTRCLNTKGNIIAIQLIQSFSENDKVTPEQAHNIGLKLIERCLSNYQVKLSTHIDTEHIHNHFVINSVSPFDGKKFHDNKRTINLLRKESDKLCYQNNLSVIEKDSVSKYSPLDQATLNAAKRGSSWKIKLIKDLDEALEKCATKDEFINYFKKNNYEIKFTDSNITIKKVGEKKGIRVDTLAKSFGIKYSKKSIESKLHINTNESSYTTPSSHSKNQKSSNCYYNTLAAHEWHRYEKKYSKTVKFSKKQKRYFFDKVIFSKNPTIFVLRLIKFICLRKHSFKNKKIKSYKYNNIKTYTDYKNAKRTVSNISYQTIISTPGDAIQLKLYAWQISKLLNDGILLSSKIDLKTGIGIITLKTFDLERVAKTLNISVESLSSQAKLIRNRKVAYELKKSNVELNYLIVSPEQVQVLREHCIKFAIYPKGDKFNIVYSHDDKDKVLSAICPNRAQNINNDTFYKRNAAVNRELKNKSAKTGEKICYKIVLSNQYKLLRKTELEFAAFRTKDGKYNVVFLEHNKNAIENALGGVSNLSDMNNKLRK